MSDRLNELERQRRLMQEHLAWLDREIAAEKTRGSGGTPATPLAPPPVSTIRPAVAAIGSAAAPTHTPSTEADQILSRFQTDPGSLQRDVRKGCLLYFAIASALVAIGGALFFLYSRSLDAKRFNPPPDKSQSTP